MLDQALTTLVPGAGLLGLLVFFVFQLSANTRTERADFRQQLTDLRGQIKEEANRADAAEERTDKERELRRAVEENLGKLTIEVARLKDQLEDATREIGVLRAQVTTLTRQSHPDPT